MLPGGVGRTPRQAVDRCAPKDGIVPFDQLVEQFMSVEPYNKAQRVFVIVDNGSAHRGKKAIKRLQGAYKNLILVHTPVHASWLNQAEIYFSIVQRKVLTPNDFADLSTLEQQLLASDAATSRSRNRSSGSSPAPTSTASPTTRPTAAKPPDQAIRRRTSNLRLTVVCNRRCTATAAATIDGRLARSLGLGSPKANTTPYPVGTGSLAAGAGSRTLTITFRSRARSALGRLRSAKLAVNVRSIDALSQRRSIYKLSTTLKR